EPARAGLGGEEDRGVTQAITRCEPPGRPEPPGRSCQERRCERARRPHPTQTSCATATATKSWGSPRPRAAPAARPPKQTPKNCPVLKTPAAVPPMPGAAFRVTLAASEGSRLAKPTT